jgi:hypothetical protein
LKNRALLVNGNFKLPPLTLEILYQLLHALQQERAQLWQRLFHRYVVLVHVMHFADEMVRSRNAKQAYGGIVVCGSNLQMCECANYNPNAY